VADDELAADVVRSVESLGIKKFPCNTFSRRYALRINIAFSGFRRWARDSYGSDENYPISDDG
jgi:hypothetical protein